MGTVRKYDPMTTALSLASMSAVETGNLRRRELLTQRLTRKHLVGSTIDDVIIGGDGAAPWHDSSDSAALNNVESLYSVDVLQRSHCGMHGQLNIIMRPPIMRRTGEIPNRAPSEPLEFAIAGLVARQKVRRCHDSFAVHAGATSAGTLDQDIGHVHMAPALSSTTVGLYAYMMSPDACPGHAAACMRLQTSDRRSGCRDDHVQDRMIF